jgi:tetratricopeptide (TPR) repeat protein
MTVLRLLLVMVAIASPAAPGLAGDEQDCFQGQEPALRIKGCSQVIQRAPNDPAGYHNRAVAYGLAGDLDNAIADYTKVIQMAPDNASAYDNRGRAYANKGDQTHAAEDRAKARELMAKAIAKPIMPRPKAPKTPATTNVSTSTSTKAPPKPKVTAKANNTVAPEAPATGFWSWLNPSNNNANQNTNQAVGKKP